MGRLLKEESMRFSILPHPNLITAHPFLPQVQHDHTEAFHPPHPALGNSPDLVPSVSMGPQKSGVAFSSMNHELNVFKKSINQLSLHDKLNFPPSISLASQPVRSCRRRHSSHIGGPSQGLYWVTQPTLVVGVRGADRRPPPSRGCCLEPSR